MSPLSFFSRGKLLLTGEYAVLDGANALALPTKFGQSLHFSPTIDHPVLQWESYTKTGECWFSAEWESDSLQVTKGHGFPETEKLTALFKVMQREKGIPSTFFSGNIKTYLDFDSAWGLGSSSTLISLISKWSNLNAYYLLEKSFGGSGYDIAAATANGPIVYRRNMENIYEPEIKPVHFHPSFLNHIYFIYSGKKKNSRDGIQSYRTKSFNPRYLSEISTLTDTLVTCTHFNQFCELMKTHEIITGNHLHLIPVQKEYFSDFQGVIKSLGAWGGDFLLILTERSRKEVSSYFSKRGLEILFSYDEIIFSA
jgi:mevalonate kinase